MSTSFFVLSKNRSMKTNNNDDDNIVSLTNKINYILPRNLMNYYSDNGLFESTLIEWCKQFCNKDKSIIDIGAHTGTYALSLSSHCKHVYAFEPQKMTYYALCGSVALSNMKNITCINKGLGSLEQVGMTTLNIVSNDGGGSSIHNNVSQPVIATEQIEIITLDSIELSEISFIKIDVEDNEKYVLQGSINTILLSNYPHILFECNNLNKHTDLFEFFKKINYNITLISGFQNMYLAFVDK